MSELDADFEISTNNLEAEYEINEGEHFDCSFEIYASGTTFSNITGSPYDNSALAEALNQKADTSTVEALSETVDNNYNTLDGKIDTHIADKTNPHEVTKAQVGLGNVDNTSDLNKPISTAMQTALNGKQNTISDLSEIRSNASNGQSAYNTIQNYGDIVTYDASSFATSVQGQKADTALQPNDDISELVNDIGYITMSALGDYATLQELENGLATKQDTINDLSDIRNDASKGANAYTTIQTYGDIVTYNASSFATSAQGALASTALQPNDNITELNNNAGYITSASLPTVNNSTITFQKNNVTVGDFNLNQSNNETINFDIPTTASDVNALPDTTTINDLTTTAQQNAIDSGANTTNIGQIATNTSNISSLSNTVTNNYNTLDGRITSEVTTLNTSIGAETTNRQNADNNLQSQIDAIVSSSDVFDIVGTYAELQAYDISTVPVNDIIKVLVDSTHSNAATYYRCIESNNVKSWSYIGAEGAYYTKSESDSLFVEQTTTVNGKALSNNITLTATDIGALPSSTTIGSGILTIQNNGVDVDTFSANATNNKTINIVTPTKTSDLTNDSGFIDSSALSTYATQTDLTNGLATKQDTISDLSTIRQNAQNGQSAYTTTGSYGDIVTYNASNFATSAQGSKADTALQQGDNISLLNNNSGFITGITGSDVTSALGYTPYNSSNPNGYTSNIGTVTSVNNIQPDSSGNVTISVTGGANTDLSNLTATGEAHFQAPLVSGTNIKTINNASLLGSGNINTNQIFIAEYGVTSYADVLAAYNEGKMLFAQDVTNNLFYTLSSIGSVTFIFSLVGASAQAEGTTIVRGLIKTILVSSNGWSILEGQLQSTYYLTTSINSSSTDTQYPSAKCVYDQLALKQNTSTAVTHTASTAVGSSTKPIYISSTGAATASTSTVGGSSTPVYLNAGTITSTGLSIASTRFDGQWVFKYKVIQTTTSTGYRTYNLGTSGTGALSYLPSDCTTYKYEVACVLFGNSSNTSYGFIASTATNVTNGIYGRISTNSNSRTSNNAFIVVVTNGMIYVDIDGSAFSSSFEATLTGYRRIGTNS